MIKKITRSKAPAHSIQRFSLRSIYTLHFTIFHSNNFPIVLANNIGLPGSVHIKLR